MAMRLDVFVSPPNISMSTFPGQIDKSKTLDLRRLSALPALVSPKIRTRFRQQRVLPSAYTRSPSKVNCYQSERGPFRGGCDISVTRSPPFRSPVSSASGARLSAHFQRIRQAHGQCGSGLKSGDPQHTPVRRPPCCAQFLSSPGCISGQDGFGSIGQAVTEYRLSIFQSRYATVWDRSCVSAR